MEITSNCNASCPGCPRTILKNENKLLINKIKLENLVKWLPNKESMNLKEIKLSGNLGDPATHSEVFGIIKFLTENYNVKLVMNTNGGVRSKRFWSELGSFSKIGRETNKFNLIVRWAIDGLKDTNHIHRVDVNWDKVFTNLRTYNINGGLSEWHLIPFEHNEHDIPKIKKICDEENIKFVLRKSVRNNKNYINKTNNEIVVSKNNNHSQIDFSNSIRNLVKIYNNKIQLNQDTSKEQEELNNYTKTIKCPHQINNQLFIASNETLWPCCMLWDETHKNKHFTQNILPKNNNWNNLNHFSMGEILNNDFYINLVNYWNVFNYKFISRCVRDCSNYGGFSTEMVQYESKN